MLRIEKLGTVSTCHDDIEYFGIFQRVVDVSEIERVKFLIIIIVIIIIILIVIIS